MIEAFDLSPKDLTNSFDVDLLAITCLLIFCSPSAHGFG